MTRSAVPSRRACALLVSMAALAAGLAAQTAPQPGTAIGTLQAGGRTITLAHAYALRTSDATGPIYRVLLTDAPIPPEMVAKELQRGGQTLLKTGKLSGLSMLVDPDGALRNVIPYVGDMRGSQMLASAGNLARFAVTATAATGDGSLTADRTMGQGWSYTARWHAVVVAEK